MRRLAFSGCVPRGLSRYRSRMRHGTTLVETLLVVTLLSLATLIMVPHLERPLAQVTVESEAHRIAAAHTRARLTSVASGRVTLLRLTGDSLTIETVAGGDTIRRWTGHGPAAAGATLSGPTRPLRFTPSGITFGVSNGTWIIEYRGVQRKVITSRLGRLRIIRP